MKPPARLRPPEGAKPCSKVCYAGPARAVVPVLILTGRWDPVAPPVYGEMAAKHLPDSLHLVVPHGGHGFGGLDGLDCIGNLIADFVNRGTTSGLDASCVKPIRREGFLLKLGEPKISR